ncbi:hypothetical protein ACJ41O_010961 [Fusarium nematophilum]
MCLRTFTRYTCPECGEFYKQDQTSEVCTAARKKKNGKMGSCGTISADEITIYDIFCAGCAYKHRKHLKK